MEGAGRPGRLPPWRTTAALALVAAAAAVALLARARDPEPAPFTACLAAPSFPDAEPASSFGFGTCGTPTRRPGPAVDDPWLGASLGLLAAGPTIALRGTDANDRLTGT